MTHRIMFGIFALAISGTTAGAADLAEHSRLGAIFAEPSRKARVVYRTVNDEAPIVPYNQLPNPPWNRGTYNYGSSWSFYYPGPYYGGSYDGDGARLPYVCGLYGYC